MNPFRPVTQQEQTNYITPCITPGVDCQRKPYTTDQENYEVNKIQMPSRKVTDKLYYLDLAVFETTELLIVLRDKLHPILATEKDSDSGLSYEKSEGANCNTSIEIERITDKVSVLARSLCNILNRIEL